VCVRLDRAHGCFIDGVNSRLQGLEHGECRAEDGGEHLVDPVAAFEDDQVRLRQAFGRGLDEGEKRLDDLVGGQVTAQVDPVDP
jgi:hypothetical protein